MAVVAGGQGQKLLLTTHEPADILGVSEPFVRKMVTSGALPSVKLGHLRRIPREALLETIQRAAETGEELVSSVR